MRFPSIATAPFSIGGPFIVTMRRARTIIFSAVAAVYDRRK
jgi:hypothetical protein